MTSAKPAAFKLPPDLVREIFKFLPEKDFIETQTTCKAFKVDYLLWQQRTGKVYAQKVQNYYQKNRKYPNYRLWTYAELRRVGRNVQSLDLVGLILGDFTELLNPHRFNQVTPLFPQLRQLELPFNFPDESNDSKKSEILGRISYHCPKLEELCIAWAYGQGELYIHDFLKGSQNITALDLKNCDIDFEKTAKLLPKLKEMHVSGHYAVTAGNIRSLLNIPSLKSIELGSGSGIEDQVMSLIPENHTVETLKIAGNSWIKNEGFKHVVRLSHLRHISIINCTAVTDFSCLSEIPSLTSVALLVGTYDVFTPQVKTLLKKPAQFHHLRFERTNGISDAALAEIGKCTELRSLVLKIDYSAKITDKGLASLSKCVQLESLSIETETTPTAHVDFTTDGMTKLVHSLPKLTTLDLKKCLHNRINPVEIERRCSLRVLRHQKAEKKTEGKN